MKRRKPKQPTDWRLIWFQVIDGVKRMRWHTGDWAECEVLRKCCEAAGETYTLSEPGTFKP